MSVLLRTLFALSVTSLFLVGCGKQEEVPAEQKPAPAPVVAPTPAPAPKAAEPGGYEPTAEERVPGITIDEATLAAQNEAAIKAAETNTAVPAAEAPAAE